MAPASAGALEITIAHVPHGWRDRMHAWIHGGDDGLQTYAQLVSEHRNALRTSDEYAQRTRDPAV